MKPLLRSPMMGQEETNFDRSQLSKPSFSHGWSFINVFGRRRVFPSVFGGLSRYRNRIVVLQPVRTPTIRSTAAQDKFGRTHPDGAAREGKKTGPDRLCDSSSRSIVHGRGEATTSQEQHTNPPLRARRRGGLTTTQDRISRAYKKGKMTGTRTRAQDRSSSAGSCPGRADTAPEKGKATGIDRIRTGRDLEARNWETTITTDRSR